MAIPSRIPPTAESPSNSPADTSITGSTLPRGDVVLAIALFLATGWACTLVPAPTATLPHVWIPTALGLAASIRLPRVARPALYMGFFVADFVVTKSSLGLPSWLALEFALWNVLEIHFGTWLLDRFVGRTSPLTIEATIRTLLATVAGMAPVGAILVASSLRLHAGTPWLSAAMGWWAATCIGLVLALLPGLSLGRDDWRQFLTKRRIVELVVSGTLLTGFVLTILQHVATPFIYIGLPLAFAALRHGLRHATLLAWGCLVATPAVYLAGLIEPPPELARLGPASLCAAAAMTIFIPLLIGVLMDQVEAQLERLKTSESRLLTLIDNLSEMIELRDRDLRKEQEAIHAIEEARAQAEHASLMKSEFVANMSHEIRTPMNAVLGMVQLIGKTSITPNQRKYLDMIRKSGRSLLGILDDILDFSKIEAGQMRIEPIDFLLDDLLENVANIASVAASGKELEISITVDPGVPSQLRGDPMRLQQVFVNLIVNAIKFTMRGEVAIHIEVLSADAATTRVGIRIRDTGIGMTEEQQRRLFQPFTQVDSSTTRRFGGTGLGLTIAKKLLDMMGGQIGVRSMSQIGTEFFVSIPFPRNECSEQDPPSLSIRPLRLLVLEDHPSTQTSLEASAARWGWKVEFASTLEQGIQRLERGELSDPFDAILVSGNLSGWDDRLSIERIRGKCHREIAVVKMVRNALDNPADEGIRLLDGILVKPIPPLSLLKALKNNLSPPRPDEDESRVQLERWAEERKTLEGVRILLVEDNAFNQVVATETLQMLGAGVDLAENGKAAVERLRRDAGSYDLVLMDVQMPVMDGYTATRLIRDELKLGIPIVAMTAGVLPSDREKCMAAGMDDFVTKPFEVDLLVRLLRQRLSLADPSTQPGTPDTKPKQRRSILDPEQLLRTLGDSPQAQQTVRRLLRQFLSTTPGSIRLATDCLGRGDLEEATRTFHNMKSSAATLGALTFSSLAHRIELGLQESERRNLQPLLEQLATEFGQVKLAADAWSRSKGDDPISEPPSSWPNPALA